MFGRIVLISLFSLLAIAGISGKLIRYVHIQPPVSDAKAGAAQVDQLQRIMQRSGFELLYTRKIYNGSDYHMGVYHYGTCNGLLYATPINPDEVEIVQNFAHNLGVKTKFIYQGRDYASYPGWHYFYTKIKQKVDLVLGKAPLNNYPLVVATVEIGQCNLLSKIEWQSKTVALKHDD